MPNFDKEFTILLDISFISVCNKRDQEHCGRKWNDAWFYSNNLCIFKMYIFCTIEIIA